MDTPSIDDLYLAGLAPLLFGDVRAAPQASVSLHFKGRLVEPGAAVPLAAAAQPPRVDIRGEGLFTLVAVEVGPGTQQRLQWLVSNIADYDFALGHQVAAYAPPIVPGRKHAFLLQAADDPVGIKLHGQRPHLKFDEETATTDTVSAAEREDFDAPGLAEQYGLRDPAAVTWFVTSEAMKRKLQTAADLKQASIRSFFAPLARKQQQDGELEEQGDQAPAAAPAVEAAALPGGGQREVQPQAQRDFAWFALKQRAPANAADRGQQQEQQQPNVACSKEDGRQAADHSAQGMEVEGACEISAGAAGGDCPAASQEPGEPHAEPWGSLGQVTVQPCCQEEQPHSCSPPSTEQQQPLVQPSSLEHQQQPPHLHSPSSPQLLRPQARQAQQQKTQQQEQPQLQQIEQQEENEYERQRAERIRRNQEVMRSMGLGLAPASPKRPAPRRPASGRPKQAAQPVGPVRRSARNVGGREGAGAAAAGSNAGAEAAASGSATARAAPAPPPPQLLLFDDSSVSRYVCEVLSGTAGSSGRAAALADPGEGRSVAGFAQLPGCLADPALTQAYSLDRRPGLVVAGGKGGMVAIWGSGIFGMHELGGQVATASKDCTVALTAVRASGELSPLQSYDSLHEHVVKCVRWRAAGPGGGGAFASCGNDRRICVVDARASPGSAGGGAGLVIDGAHGSVVNCLRWHPQDEQLLLSTSFDPAILVHDLRSPGRPLFALQGHSPLPRLGSIYQPAFVAGGDGIATGGERSSQLTLYCCKTGATISRGTVDIGIHATCSAGHDIGTMSLLCSTTKAVFLFAPTWRRDEAEDAC
eukprot:scaffold15.g4293.t1